MVAAVIGYAAGEGGKFVFSGNFPSHHAMYSLIIGLSLLIYYKKIGLTLCVISLGIGIWRVIGGFHTPFEVFGGYVLAGMSVFATNIIVFWAVHGD